MAAHTAAQAEATAGSAQQHLRARLRLRVPAALNTITSR